MTANAQMGALAGLKVLDLSVMLAGPFCTMLLADQGADVIKIEPPGGDKTRLVGPFPDGDTRRDFGGYFQSINRNKRSLVLDLKSPAGREVLLRLVKSADVVMENYRVGVMDRLGLGYERLREVNPKLVYGSLRGFGDPRTGRSPYAEWPAYDVVAQAMGGAMGITGPTREQPLKIGPGIGDTVPAMMLAVGILSAVRHAERTGKGQFVDIAMYDAVLALCERIVYQHSYSGAIPVPEGNGHPFLCPFGLFAARDGWVSIACPQDDFWRDLCRIIGRAELGDDPRYATNADRAKHRDAVIQLLSEWTAARTKAEIAAELGGRIPFGPVNNAADIFADAHVRSRRMLAELEHPGASRPATVVNTPVRMTETPGGVRCRAPTLGEHREEVLQEHGYSPIDIARLHSAGAFGLDLTMSRSHT